MTLEDTYSVSSICTVLDHGLRNVCEKNAVTNASAWRIRTNAPSSRFIIQYKVHGSTVDLPTQGETYAHTLRLDYPVTDYNSQPSSY